MIKQNGTNIFGKKTVPTNEIQFLMFDVLA